RRALVVDELLPLRAAPQRQRRLQLAPGAGAVVAPQEDRRAEAQPQAERGGLVAAQLGGADRAAHPLRDAAELAEPDPAGELVLLGGRRLPRAQAVLLAQRGEAAAEVAQRGAPVGLARHRERAARPPKVRPRALRAGAGGDLLGAPHRALGAPV